MVDSAVEKDICGNTLKGVMNFEFYTFIRLVKNNSHLCVVEEDERAMMSVSSKIERKINRNNRLPRSTQFNSARQHYC